ncbi:hypothetical protein [Salinarimonas ramus]|uniref:Uncharacterized protein n=1 Tax=Salinarimonas ramus TaxID=690164 RepID=A0A917V6C0_9HYPH|nr:hypothetical protein [Salinarimonas ramus]GGK44227.1 hypothetical protein GCM10011322_34220 [Salinarimonas ramus]
MSNDKLFNPLGVIVPGLVGGGPRIPGEPSGDADFKQALEQPQAGGSEAPRQQPQRQQPLVAGGGLMGTTPMGMQQPPQTIAAGFAGYAARNADQIKLEYDSSFASEA